MDTMTVGLERSPHSRPTDAEVPPTTLGVPPRPKAPKTQEWTEKDSEAEWERMGLPKDWQWQLHKERTPRRAGYVLRNWLLAWASKEFSDKEGAELVLDAALSENTYGGVWEDLKAPRPNTLVLSRLCTT